MGKLSKGMDAEEVANIFERALSPVDWERGREGSDLFKLSGEEPTQEDIDELEHVLIPFIIERPTSILRVKDLARGWRCWMSENGLHCLAGASPSEGSDTGSIAWRNALC